MKGGGTTSQIYAIRQAIAKGIVAYYQKCKSNHMGVVNNDYTNIMMCYCVEILKLASLISTKILKSLICSVS